MYTWTAGDLMRNEAHVTSLWYRNVYISLYAKDGLS